MSEYVTDTHALSWHLTLSPRLSPTAGELFSDADQGLHRIFVPSIALVEMVYLVARRRLDEEPVERLFRLLRDAGSSYTVASLDRETAVTLRRVSRSAVSDMPDRIVGATALQLGLALTSRDEAIRRATIVPVIW